MKQPKYGEQQLYINGELTEASNSRVYDNISPVTEAVIGVTADADMVNAEDALAGARRAFDDSDWCHDHKKRAKHLRAFVERMQANAEDFIEAVIAEAGSTRALAHGPQATGPLEMVTWILDYLEQYSWQRHISNYEVMGVKSRREVWKEAAGVVGAISPWNFPIQINLAKCLPALAAGCTVVLKPAPDTPWCATLMGRSAYQAGLPAGVFQVVSASDPVTIGTFLSSDPRVDVVSFTGSTTTGKQVMRNAADTIKKVFLELGGKSALIILDDADLATALLGGFGATIHAGQGCAIITRILVPRHKLAEAEKILKDYFAGVNYGSDDTSQELMGPLINAKQRERVLGFIETAKKEGAKLLCGGATPQHTQHGYYVEPTIFSEVDNSMTIAQQEIFGPVLALIPFDNDEHAIQIANDSIYGLSGAVHSASEERAKKVAANIRSGTININGGNFYGPDGPFGGYKQSGIGREMGAEGFEEYLETKTVGFPA